MVNSVQNNLVNTERRIVFLDGIRGWASYTALLSNTMMYFLHSLTSSMPLLKFDKSPILD